MIGTEVIVEGGHILDVFEGLDFSFNYAVSDIRNPDTRQTEFTKTIKLPGTGNNNTLFGNLFEADIANPFDPNIDNIGVNFNPNKKASVQVLRNSIPQLDGSMQLRKITVTKGRIEYEVVFIGQLIDIFGVWGDRKMNEVDETGVNIIDLSEFDHLLTDTAQAASWSATLGDGYVYPLIDYGRNFTIDTVGRRTYPVEDLRPAMYVRTLWDKIFEYAGATYSGDFLNVTQSDGFDFDRLILPWTSGFELSDDEIQISEVQVNRGTDIAALDPTTAPLPLTQWPLVFDNVITDDSSQYSAGTGDITVFNTGVYVIAGALRLRATRTLVGTATGAFNVNVRITVNGAQVANSIASAAMPANTVGATVTSIIAFTSPELTINSGDVVDITYGVADQFTASFLRSEADFLFEVGSNMSMDRKDAVLAVGDLVRMKFGLPDISIKDFFLSLLKMFNLYMLPDKSIPNHYIFYTRDQFYASGQLKDWTYKMDRGQAVTVTPMGLLSGREYIYTYAEDGDYFNERYQNNYGRVYGSRKLDIDNDFVPERKESEVVFSATPLANDGVSARIIPKIYDADISDGQKPTDTNLRILYYGGLLDGVVTWRHGTSGTYYSDYPYAGHWDNPITPALDINFGLSLEYYYSANGATGTLQMTNNNLFKAYHERQFLELSNKDSKLIMAYFDLTALDIHQLDFRDTILIDQTYYRINKVMDYNPFKAGLTKVELFKAGDIAWASPRSAGIGSGTGLGTGKLTEFAPATPVKTLVNGNQFEPFQGKVIGTGNVVSPNAVGFFIQGDGNMVGASKNVTLIGSGNTVANGVENVVAVGVNNQTITESNSHVFGDCLCVKTVKVDVTSAQILNINTTPVDIVPAPPVGFAVCLIHAAIKMDFNTTSYGTNTDLKILHPSATASQASFPSAVLGSLISIFNFTSPANQIPNTNIIEAEKLILTELSGNPAFGDSDITVYASYVLIPV
jgi:hypothetical protein